MEKKARTEIASLGQFNLVKRLTSGFTAKNNSTTKAVGDDAAVIDAGDKLLLVSTELLLEGIQFDLTYVPLAHLGYKAVVAAISDLYAMNGTPKQLLVSIGVSAKLSVEDLESLYDGIHKGCETYGIDLVGGDTSASVTGLSLSVTAVGEVAKNQIVYRGGAAIHDLICLTGDLGAAYMGLQLLEREKKALSQIENPEPKFEGYTYLLQRQLKPEVPARVIEALHKNEIRPTSMIDITDGLSSEVLQLCEKSNLGARIYLNRLPIAEETFALAEELGTDPVIAALNGGEDYELLFTIPLDQKEKIAKIPGVEVIGHTTTPDQGAYLVTPDGSEIHLTAPGWVAQE